jgi:hypothetical protein
MDRRTILATAGAITLVVVTGAAAAAANVGLLGSADGTGAVGSLTPASAMSEPQTVIVEPAPADATPPTTAAQQDRTDGSSGPHADDDGRSEEHDRSEADHAHERYEGSHDDD